jgi:hypothetical protein
VNKLEAKVLNYIYMLKNVCMYVKNNPRVASSSDSSGHSIPTILKNREIQVYFNPEKY